MKDFVEQFLETSERHYRSDSGPERLTEAAKEFQAGLTELMERTVAATDERNYVEATVSLGSKLVQTYISPEAMRDLDGWEVADACREAIGAARALAVETFQAEVGEFPERFRTMDPAELIRRNKV